MTSKMYVRRARILKNIININKKTNKQYIYTYGMHLFLKNLINLASHTLKLFFKKEIYCSSH